MKSTNKILISIEEVSHSFTQRQKTVHALSSVTLSVAKGEFIAVVGPSGCGKTTLLKIIGGLLTPGSGTVSIHGDTPTRTRKERRIGMVFQDPIIFPWRNVIENVLLPAEISRFRNREGAREDKSTVRRRAQELIDLVGLTGFEKSFPSELSGGMQSRVAIARAMSYSPDILLMDEPFGNLDEITRTRLNVELINLHRLTKSTIIFVTHSTREAALLANRVVVLSRRPGTILEIVSIDIPRRERMESETASHVSEYAERLRRRIESSY